MNTHDANLIPAWHDGRLQPMDKLSVHMDGLRHQAVSVFLMRGDAVLLQRRAMGKYHTPGLWANTCCTHPHWGEDPGQCAQRRLVQELGITGQVLTHRGVVEYRADVGGGMVEDEVVDVFVGQATDDLSIQPNPAEVMDWRWVPLDDLGREIADTSDIFTPWLRIYLAQHRAQILGDGPPAT